MKIQSKLYIMMTTVSLMALSGCSTSDVNAAIANGDSVSTTNTQYQTSNPNQIKIYYSKHETPKHFKVIGRISASHYNMVGLPSSQESIRKELQNQAAKLGANGVIDVESGMVNTTANAVIIR